jgi:hypothetical protein
LEDFHTRWWATQADVQILSMDSPDSSAGAQLLVLPAQVSADDLKASLRFSLPILEKTGDIPALQRVLIQIQQEIAKTPLGQIGVSAGQCSDFRTYQQRAAVTATKKQARCSICHLAGHNKKTCGRNGKRKAVDGNENIDPLAPVVGVSVTPDMLDKALAKVLPTIHSLQEPSSLQLVSKLEAFPQPFQSPLPVPELSPMHSPYSIAEEPFSISEESSPLIIPEDSPESPFYLPKESPSSNSRASSVQPLSSQPAQPLSPKAELPPLMKISEPPSAPPAVQLQVKQAFTVLWDRNGGGLRKRPLPSKLLESTYCCQPPIKRKALLPYTERGACNCPRTIAIQLEG